MLISSLWFVLLVLGCLLGLFMSVFQLPGSWVILMAALGYGWHEGFHQVSFRILAVLAAMALAGELIELFPSMMLARRAGASGRAGWAALAGGFLGMFLFSFPLPVIGTVAGGVMGCFLGALAAELTVRDDVDGAVRVGLAAAVGRVVGLFGKLAMAMAMTGLAIGAAVW